MAPGSVLERGIEPEVERLAEVLALAKEYVEELGPLDSEDVEPEPEPKAFQV